MYEHGMHGLLWLGQAVQPGHMCILLGPQLLQPGERLPGFLRSLLGQLFDHGLDITDNAHGDAAVAADLRCSWVNLDDAGVGANYWRLGIADSVILFAA